MPCTHESPRRALPRALVRLIRSGTLSQEKLQRLLSIHGVDALEAVGVVRGLA